MMAEVPATDGAAGSRFAVIRGDEVPPPVVADPRNPGLRESVIVGERTGSVHVEIAVAELAAGAAVPGHVHPYEESFYVREGEVLFRIGERTYELVAGDFGVAPIGMAHAWRNVGGRPASWLRIRAPQPRALEGAPRGVFPVSGLEVPESGVPISESDPTHRFVGRFREEQMPAPGPVAARGVNAYNVRNVATRWMVDDTLGATHHVVFRGTMTAPPVDPPPGHYHPFEEAYHILSGDIDAHVNGEVHRIGPGDTIWMGVNAIHGFRPLGGEPMRWIETMAPRPPEQDSMLFPHQWAHLAPGADG